MAVVVRFVTTRRESRVSVPSRIGLCFICTRIVRRGTDMELLVGGTLSGQGVMLSAGSVLTLPSADTRRRWVFNLPRLI